MPAEATLDQIATLKRVVCLGERHDLVSALRQVDDVRELCSNVAIINHGRVVVQGSPTALLDEVPRLDAEQPAARHEVVSSKLAAGSRVLRVFSATDAGDGFAAAEPDLEDVYFHRPAAQERRDA